MNRVQKLMLKFLLQHPNGVKRSVLLSYLWEQRVNVSDRQMRKEKEALVLAGIPVGSDNERGYFIIKTEKDLDDCKRLILSRIKSELKIINALTQGYHKYNNTGKKVEQLTLFAK